MLATLVIGLREGLEAALIVSIIAAFLRKNGRSLLGMWIGVTAAVLLSIAVGVVLELIEAGLPQAAQEAMETIIGAVAVVFVTTMIVWMSTHARGMKRELETSASAALGAGSARALALMAFLAVMKEGFETAVFLLATFKAASSGLLAATGALLGILGAVALGIGMYRGGIKINLAKFFKATSVFLILVAAGLVVSALRTAHEAGWLNGGQQQVADLSWLAPRGSSVQAALVTGVLGIPPDPRLVEALGWFGYLVPMALFLFWPARHRPGRRTAQRLRLAGVAVLVGGAAALFIAVPRPQLAQQGPAPVLDDQGAQIGTVELRHGRLLLSTNGAEPVALALAASRPERHAGVKSSHIALHGSDPTDALPKQVRLDDLLSWFGRLPVGISATDNPGPFTARWKVAVERDIWTVDGQLLDAKQERTIRLTLSGGGLATSRTVTLPATARPQPDATTPTPLDQRASWAVDPQHVDAVTTAVSQWKRARTNTTLWRYQIPIVLLLAAGWTLAVALRSRSGTEAASSSAPEGRAPRTDPARSTVDVP